MKQKATNSMENLKSNLRILGLCLVLAASGTSMTIAQHVMRPNIVYDLEQVQNISNERNPSTGPIRNITINQICPAITSIYMVDMGFDKALVEWDNMLNFDTILFRVTPQGSPNSRIITIDGTPNPGRYFIMGLLSQTTYDIEVSSVCSNGMSTPWSTPITVNTLSPRFSSNNLQRNANRMHITPNPASVTARISFMVSAITPQQVTITSATGQEMFKSSILPNADKVEIDVNVANYPNGVYIVKVSNNTGISVERLIVQ